MQWIQNYYAVADNIFLTAFCAAIPMFFLFWALAIKRMGSGALFGNLQRVTAAELGVNPLITVTASMVGAVMGKLISPQTIAIATAAAGIVGQEGEMLRGILKHALILLVMGIIIMWILANFFPGYFPIVQ
jgi:lactate permease